MPNQSFHVSTILRLLSVICKSFIFNQAFFLKIRINLNLSFDESEFKKAPSTKHPHKQTSLGKIDAGLVAIGGANEGRVVEIFANGYWVQQPPCPEDGLKDYSIVTYENALYVFGE